MIKKSFKSTVTKAGSKTIISIPFNPNDTWGKKEGHYVTGSINGRPFRGLLVSDGILFFLPVGAAWCRDAHLAQGTTVKVILSPEGPQLDLISNDIALALGSEPKAKAFFESLATFYRKNYIRWIESAKRPETRKARIAELEQKIARGK